jgi:cobalt/nickel transport system ATP-binding protein
LEHGAARPARAGTRVIAAHDLETILRTCGRVLLLDRGRLVADGPPGVVLSDAALMEAHGLEVPHSLRGRRGGRQNCRSK